MLDVQDDIIVAFRQGDRAAFNTIYLQLRKPIITFCKYMVPLDDAEDITSDVFVRLWKFREQWNTINDVKAFLYVSARNGCLNFLKQQKTRSDKQKEIAGFLERQQEMILQSQIESELISLIKTEVDNLPDTCRTVFTLSYFEGYENAEIAERLSISDKTVRNLKSIALKTIKKNLESKGLQLSGILMLVQMIKRLP
ncbi:RNA polymerase sigma-70 factor [Niastella caeni]|uniref:RNA polymerase sigma-70 factor n=1 Tax=Niastella caeni TaxID=2569763 RepID=A0A4S8HYN9_9BACT|nr:RNA polymerase sigma-70 factor [Niastella caeni]THU40451.1 RNA polymerase sigma-70 factor [Niastella caeni]